MISSLQLVPLVMFYPNVNSIILLIQIKLSVLIPYPISVSIKPSTRLSAVGLFQHHDPLLWGRSVPFLSTWVPSCQDNTSPSRYMVALRIRMVCPEHHVESRKWKIKREESKTKQIGQIIHSNAKQGHTILLAR